MGRGRDGGGARAWSSIIDAWSRHQAVDGGDELTDQRDLTRLDWPRSRTGLDSGLASVARIYDFLLGGDHHLAADREAGRRLLEAVPEAAQAARDNRAFLRRSVEFLCTEGIDQFLDIGTGLPAAGHVHEVAWAVNPDARVVYADNDPAVVGQAGEIIGYSDSVVSVLGDARYPGELLCDPAIRKVINFSRPVAVLLVAVLHFIPDSQGPWSAVRVITDHMAPGSYLVVSHVTGDDIPSDAVRRAEEIYSGALVQGAARSRAAVGRFFDGTEIIAPGVASVTEWRPGRLAPAIDGRVVFWAGIGRKPGRPGGKEEVSA
jgi:hypothetical protein